MENPIKMHDLGCLVTTPIFGSTPIYTCTIHGVFGLCVFVPGVKYKALLLSHPHVLIRDTSLFRPLRPPGLRKIPSLRRLADYWLQEKIQESRFKKGGSREASI